jgi:uncharacterized protein (DUF58 family)
MTDNDQWSGPGARAPREPFAWNNLLWMLVYPQRGHRILPTIPGVVLISLAFGIGTAAYNSSSNILFITLSLLLACLILSGVLSWLNLRRVSWRLLLHPPLRAGHDTVVALDLRNGKNFLPTYGLWFEFVARAVAPEREQRAESTVSGRGIDVRATLAKADAAENRTRLMLTTRLDPKGEARIEWVFKPDTRGALRVELLRVGSLFPFGFLRKEVGTHLVAETVVWPAPIEYRRHALASARRTVGGERVARAGSSGDLLALRRYTAGDSHRLIHWKASARLRQLLVRQFAAESSGGYSLWLRTDGGVWRPGEQFETLISFVATLAEDLFRAGQLMNVAIDADRPRMVRRVHDLENFLDCLAVARPHDAAVDTGPDSAATIARKNLMTFAPDGARGVAAYVDGQKAASA